MAIERMKDGTARKFAWPGGYPIAYLINSEAVVCPECAVEAEDDGDVHEACGFANWEDEHLYCDDCGEHIPSAYGDDEDDTD